MPKKLLPSNKHFFPRKMAETPLRMQSTQKKGRKRKGKRTRGVRSALCSKIQLSRDYIFRSRKKSTMRAELAQKHKDLIHQFLEREDNSYEMPGKKDQIRWRETFALCDTMRNLHAKFIRENAGLPVSVATFCRSRPRHISE